MLRAATTGLPVKVIAFGGIKPALALKTKLDRSNPKAVFTGASLVMI